MATGTLDEAAAEAPSPPRQARSAHAELWAAVIPAIAALAICLLQLHIRHWWSGVDGYDDGVYVSSAVELARGVLPYRDYTLVQPPGITILLSPVALLARLLGYGTQDVVFFSRLITAIVTALDAALVALVVRHRGAVAMFVAGMAFASFPAANQADSVALLEPYVDLFCLLGLVLLFSGGKVTTGWRVYAAGVGFGLASGFKVWALLPAGIVFVFAGLAGRDRIVRFAVGVATGAAVIFGPFATAPGALIRDVFSAQVNRISVQGVHRLLDRLYYIFGFNEVGRVWVITVIIAGWLVIVALAHAGTDTSEPAARFDHCIFTVALVATVIFILGSPFYTHYAFLVTPWFAILFGSVCARALSNTSRLLGARRGLSHLSWEKIGSVTAVGLTVIVGVSVSVSAFRDFASSDFGLKNASDLALVTRLPSSSCFVTDQIAMAVSANRLSNEHNGCPLLIDSDGIRLVDEARFGSGTAARTALARQWQGWFGHADYVYLSDRFPIRIPWTGRLSRWFYRHFTPMPVRHGLGTLYRRKSPRA